MSNLSANCIRLLEEFPLYEGEDVVAEFHGKMLDDEGNSGQHVTVVLTPFRIGVWQPPDSYMTFMGCLVEVDWVEDKIRIGFDNNIYHLIEKSNNSDPNEFCSNVIYFRRGILRNQASEALKKGLQWLLQGDVNRGIVEIKNASNEDPFHPGPNQVLCSLYRYKGLGQEAADTYTQVLMPAYMMSVNTSVSWAELPLKMVHFISIARQWGIQEPWEKLPPGRLWFGAHYLKRLGKLDDVKRLLELAYRKHESDNPFQAVLLLALHSVQLLEPSSRQEFRKKVEAVKDNFLNSDELSPNDRDGLENSFNRIIKIFDIDINPVVLAEAILADTGSQDYEGWSCRILELWQEAATPEPERELSNINWDNINISYDEFEPIIEWVNKHFNLDNEAERAWAHLRLGHPEKAIASISSPDPVKWFMNVAEAFNRECPQVWLAALVVTEMLLISGKHEEAKSFLSKARQTCSSGFGSALDIYTSKASDLFGLYWAFATRDVTSCRLYVQRFGGEVGFSWVKQAALVLLPDAVRPINVSGYSQLKCLSEFDAWIQEAARRLNLERDVKFQETISRFQEARSKKALTVVVGGETSAGKSSFINALVGQPVLHVTQEEATAVPTIVVQGHTWSASVFCSNNQVLDKLDIGCNPSDSDRQKIAEFVRCYTFIGSDKCNGVSSLRLTVPTDAIPPDVEIVDTPGLNAHALRTKLAQDTIDTAHACFFVMDAANALKAGEMNKITWVHEAAAKTIFIINKMDRAVSDDELDVDVNADMNVIDRVQNELSSHLGVSKISLFGVCSLSKEVISKTAISTESMRYAEAVEDVRDRLKAILRSSRQDLISYSASKVARVVARIALEKADSQVATFESEIGRLTLRLPDDPASFRQHVVSLTQEVWDQAVGTYISRLRDTLTESVERVQQAVFDGINSCSNGDQLKSFVKGRLRGIFNDHINRIDAARAKEWSEVGRIVMSDVERFFNALYEDSRFKASTDTRIMLKLATPMPLSQSLSGVESMLDSLVSDSNLWEVGGAAAGAVIGSFFAPVIGTAIGAFLGSMVGSSMSDDLKQKLYDAIGARFDDIHELAVAALDADIKEDGVSLPPIRQAIMKIVDDERNRFERQLKAEINRIELKQNEAAVASNDSRSLAAASSEWTATFDGLLSVQYS